MNISMTTKVQAIGLVAKHLGTTIRDLGFCWSDCIGGDHIVSASGRVYAADLVIGKVRDITPASECRSRIELPTPRRACNGLNVEIATPAARCINKPPVNHLGMAADAFRWLGSGGSPLAFGVCDVNRCPLRKAVK